MIVRDFFCPQVVMFPTNKLRILVCLSRGTCRARIPWEEEILEEWRELSWKKKFTGFSSQ